MAEALAVVGLAANIAQFTEHGIAILAGARKIYQSGQGALEENLALEHVLADVRG